MNLLKKYGSIIGIMSGVGALVSTIVIEIIYIFNSFIAGKLDFEEYLVGLRPAWVISAIILAILCIVFSTLCLKNNNPNFTIFAGVFSLIQGVFLVFFGIFGIIFGVISLASAIVLCCSLSPKLASSFTKEDIKTSTTEKISTTEETSKTEETSTIEENKLLKDKGQKSVGKEALIVFLLSFFIGILGADKFYKKQAGLGVLKIFTLGGLGIWYFIDWILELVNLVRVL